MSLSKNFRWVQATNLSIRNERSVPAHVPTFSFEEVEDVLRQKIEADEAVYSFLNETRILRIRELSTDHADYLILLVSVGDKNAPIPSYENFGTGQIRSIEPDEDEGLSLASHIVIKRQPDENGCHLMMIEKVPGIHISGLTNFLRHLFNDPSVKKEYEDLDGETKEYRPLFEITGYMNQTLRDALTTGKLQDIEFISHRAVDAGHDEYGYIQERVQQATFVVKRGVTTDTVDGFFENMTNQFRADQNYDKMFVRIKTTKGQIRRTEIDTDQEDILSQGFFRNDVINDFATPLEKTHEEINTEVVNKILNLMGNYEQE